MAKIKPNQNCPCGSGKKFKKCCGARIQAEPSISNDKGPAHPQLIGTWGLSGMSLNVAIKRGYQDPNDPRNAFNPSGSPGKYKVSVVLSRPQYAPLKENHISFADDIEGDSHIFIGDPNEMRAECEADLPDGNYTYYGYPNDHGFLSKIELEFDAESFDDSTLKAYNILSPVLSRLSLAADVPLNIYKMTTTELSTQNLMSNHILPFAEKQAPFFTNYQLDKDLVKFASLYREALNSNSPNYQFLCYYKIIEGIREIRQVRRARVNQEAVANGENPPIKEKEFLPTFRNEQLGWLNSIFTPQNWSDLALSQVFLPQAVGRKLTDLISKDKELHAIRLKIAHTVLQDETKETYNLDDGSHINEVTSWLPLCKCLTRYFLKQEYPQSFGMN